MKDKDDRIKELAKDMGIGFQLSGTTRFGPVAAELVEMGYQRIKKDDIVISREEYGKLTELKAFFETCGTISTKELYDYMQEFKEGTIKEIIIKIKQFLSNVETVVDDDKYSLYPEIGYKCSKVDDFIDKLEKEEFTKQLDIEIKE